MLSIVEAISLIELHQAGQTFSEIFEILLFGLRPLYFGKGSHTGQYHVFYVFGGMDILCPEIGLGTENMLALFFGKSCRYGFQTIYLFDGHIPADTERFILCVCRLIIVEIAERGRSHDNIVSQLCSFDAAFHTAP